MMKTRESGFTLIELVVVITILGILAAFALPRFANLQGDARKAVILGVAGSMESAAALAHSAQLAAGSALNDSVVMEGQTVTMTNGYPTADTNGIMKAIRVSNSSGLDCSSGNICQHTGAASPASCQVQYTAPASAGNAPTITPTVTDCN